MKSIQPKRKRPKSVAPRVAVVGSLVEARAALASAGGVPVVLVSPPGAAHYLGVGFFRALVDAARAEFPGAVIDGVMDCGDAPGFALSALRLGFKTVVLRGEPRAHARVAAIARSMGARILLRPPRPGSAKGGGRAKKGKGKTRRTRRSR